MANSLKGRKALTKKAHVAQSAAEFLTGHYLNACPQIKGIMFQMHTRHPEDYAW